MATLKQVIDLQDVHTTHHISGCNISPTSNSSQESIIVLRGPSQSGYLYGSSNRKDFQYSGLCIKNLSIGPYGTPSDWHTSGGSYAGTGTNGYYMSVDLSMSVPTSSSSYTYDNYVWRMNTTINGSKPVMHSLITPEKPVWIQPAFLNQSTTGSVGLGGSTVAILVRRQDNYSASFTPTICVWWTAMMFWVNG
jgi:hypothetical protein